MANTGYRPYRLFTFLLFLIAAFSAFSGSLSHLGDDFWIAFSESRGNPLLQLAISSPEGASVTIESGDGEFQMEVNIPANFISHITIPDSFMLNGDESRLGGALHILSDGKISVTAIYEQTSNGESFLALPVNALSNKYRAICGDYSTGSLSQVAIAAPFNDTQVTITLRNGSGTRTTTLQRGDAYQLVLSASALNGSLVESNHPIALFCSFRHSDNYDTRILIEQQLPISTWGNRYLLAPMPNMIGESAFIAASEPNTTIQLHGNMRELQPGSILATSILGPTEIISPPDKPITVLMFGRGTGNSPMMATVPSVDQYLSRIDLRVPVSGSSTVQIIAPVSNIGSYFIDGNVISPSEFQNFPGDEYAVANLPLGSDLSTLNSSGGLPLGAILTTDNGQSLFANPAGMGISDFIDVTPLNQPEIGSAMNFRVRAPENFTPTFSFICYRPLGKSAYTIANLTDLGGGIWEGGIPAEFMTERGVEYHISFSDGLVQRTFPGEDAELEPALLVLRADQYVSNSFTPLLNEYQMVSIPLAVGNSDITSIVQDDYGEYDPLRWRLFRWLEEEESDPAYIELPDMSAGQSQVGSGRAFWLIHAGGIPFDVDSANTIASVEPQQVYLERGWNQIGNPFAFPVAWDTVGGTASVQGLYEYRDGEYRIVTVMEPWKGYFVNNNGPLVNLMVPPVEAGSGSLTKRREPRGAGNFTMQLTATLDGTPVKDSQNFIGWRSGDSEIIRRQNYPEPPAIHNALRLSIREGGQRYMRYFSAVSGSGGIWEIELATADKNRQVTLTLQSDDALPSDYQVYVLDKDRFKPLSIVNDRIVFSNLAGQQKNLMIIIGTETFARDNSGGIPLEPLHFTLFDNYPNPFNPETTIRYQLPEKGRVDLAIYNSLGQRVRTLVAGEQTTGSYSIRWDGRADSGHPVASGIYIYRLRAGNNSAANRMILLR